MFIAYFVEQIWKFTELKDNESVMNNCARHSLCTFVHDVHGINHNNAADSRVWPTLLCTVQVDVISLSVGSFNFRKDSTLFIHIRGNLIKMANILNAHLDHHVYHTWITSEILFIYIYLLIVPIWKWISWLLGEHFFIIFKCTSIAMWNELSHKIHFQPTFTGCETMKHFGVVKKSANKINCTYIVASRKMFTLTHVS